MATVVLGDDAVDVRLRRWEKLAGLLRDQRLPFTAISRVEFRPRALRAASGWRAPGTSVPWLLKIGTYRGRLGRQFVDVRRGQPAVLITLSGHRYASVLIGSDRAEELAADLAARAAR